VPDDANPNRLFSAEFDDEFPVGGDERNNAYFGTNVLKGLVDGIDDFVHERQQRWCQFRSLGPVLLGSAMWIDDELLIDKLAELAAACVVITKQGRGHRKLEPLAALNERAPGIPVRAFAELTELAPKVNGKPLVVGPNGPTNDQVISTIRTVGFRRTKGSSQELPPILHAKLALLGNFWWHDEGPLGHVDDVIGFSARRLWISSANFTISSRRSLEFGYWTEDPALIRGAERFLVKLMRSSESVDPESDSFSPELEDVEYDQMAMAEAWAAMHDDDEWDEGDDRQVDE
jgi:hypothetical protein